MLFMNESDVSHALCYYKGVKLQAVKILNAHMEVVNANSDGWAYWSAPVRAAKRLMEYIQAPHMVLAITEKEMLKVALRPIKAFYTKHPQLPRPKEIDEIYISGFSLKDIQQTAKEVVAERMTREGLIP